MEKFSDQSTEDIKTVTFEDASVDLIHFNSLSTCLGLFYA